MYPRVDPDTCTGCGTCVQICPSEVYEMEEDQSNPTRREECIECLACVNQCPAESIQLHED